MKHWALHALHPLTPFVLTLAEESHCAEYSKILWASTSCKRRQCDKHFAEGEDEGQWMQVFWHEQLDQ